MAKAFVSYSRKDIEFAKRLTGELQKSEMDFWVDWEGIPPTVDWWEKIENGIEEADVFLFLISPDSAKSKVCGQEIETAVKNGKRLIPLVVREIAWGETPPHLGHLNYIFFREGDDFDAAVKKLLTAIHTDYEWVQTHRELQVKGLEWERHNHENSFLLRGKELQDAELQLATNTSKEPYPTDLQRDYVFNSRKSADRQRRIVTSVSIAGVIALAALAVFGFIKAGQATTNAEASNHNAATAQANLVVAQTAQADAQIANTAVVSANATTESNLILTQNELRKARNQALSAQSEQISNEAPSASILLALEAIKLNQDANEPTSHASYQALRDALFNTQGNPMEGNSEVILAMKYSKDGHWFATGGKDGLVRVWDTKQSVVRGLPMFTLNCQQGEVQYLFLSDNGSRLVTMGSDKKVCAWNMTAFDPVQTVVKVTADLPTVDDFAASPDGRWAAAGNVEANQVVIWDLEDNTAFDPIKISDKPALGSLHLVFNPEESLLLVSNDTTMQFWSIETTGPVRNSGGGFVTIYGGD